MNKKLFKKALTAVLTAALLFTSSGFASLNASAAEKIYVEGVYTNFQKATMSTGTSRQINAYVEPSNATVQVLQYKSSAPEVASVSSTGLISALSPGKATITVTALDGSSQTEKIKITVLEDLFITGDMVDSDNDVVVLDKTYGNLYIDGSVGDADIYLSGVTVRNILAMGSGDYSLYTYDSAIKELMLDDVAGEIESFAITDEDNKAAPNLIVGENTQINNLNARISASIRQEDGSAIEGLRVTQDAEGKITVYLENYSGGLLLDSSLGDMEIITTGCSLSSVNVTGSEDAGNVHLVNGGESEISNLILSKAANVTLDVPTAQVDIDSNASGAALTSNSDIGALTDAGSGSHITVAGSVDSFEANGSGSNINVASGGYVGMINLNGEGSKLSGAGTVSEAYVNANNVSVDTVNTLVVVSEQATGTKVQGNNVAGGSTTTTKPPVGGGGGGGPLPPPVEKEIQVGDIIYKNDFEDGMHRLMNNAQGGVTIAVKEDEQTNSKVAYVSGKTEVYAGAAISLSGYSKKRVTIRLKADIKAEEAGHLKATIKYYNETLKKNDYQQVAEKEEANANEWYSIEGTFELANNMLADFIYFESPEKSNYSLDNIEITVDKIGDPIPVTGIELDPAGPMSLDIGEVKRLTPVIIPDTADNKEVTWLSEDPSIATVNEGAVRGVAAGNTKIIATTVDGKFTAEVEVTVTDNVIVEIPASENFEKMEAGTKLKWLGYGGDGEATVIVDPSNPFNKLLEVKPSANYDRASIINITLPEGKTLGDYSKIKYKVMWKSGDVGYKDVLVEADTILSGTFSKTPDRVIASYNRRAGATMALAEETINLNGKKSGLSGDIQISIGINCKASEGEAPTIYYLDDIVFVPKPDFMPIAGVELNKDTITLVEGRTDTLTATINPLDYTTTPEITWTSSEPAVATVDGGTVTALSAGTATITVTVKEIESELEYTDTCTVTVEAGASTPAPEVVIDFNSDSIGAAYKTIGWGPFPATVAAVSGGGIQALEIKPNNYNASAVISVIIPEGFTLGDYEAISIMAYWKSGDVGWKTIRIEAAKVLSGAFNENDTRLIGSRNRDLGVNTDFELLTIDLSLNGELGMLSGTIELAIGIHCGASANGEDTVYYLDDIKLIPKS